MTYPLFSCIKMFNKNPIVNLFRYTWRYSIGKKKYFLTFILLGIIANIILLMEPLIIGRVFNNVQFSYDDPELFTYIIKNLSLLILTTIGFWIFHGISRVMEQRNAYLVRKNYKQEMFDKVLNLPAQWHKDHHSGDTIDKISKAGDKLNDFAESIFFVTENTTRMVGAIIIIAIFDWQATVIALVVSIIAIGSILRFDKVLRRMYLKIFRRENFLTAGIYDFISNIITIITLRLKSRASKEIGRRLMLAFPIYRRALPIQETKWFLVSLYIALMTVGILIINAYQSLQIKGVIIIGTLFVLYRYLNSIGGAFYAFAWRWGEMVREDAALRAAEVINDEYNNLKTASSAFLPSDWRILQIKNLSFTYRTEGVLHGKQGQLRNVSLTIEKNKKYALIGESGSGKSTVFSLMRGLHEVDQVIIFSNGKRLPNNMAHLYEHVTLIPQEPELFNSTIEYNITLGAKTNVKKLDEVIRMACFEPVVKRLKRGLKTNVMEKGVSLSVGEKQRLALARGLLSAPDSQFLLLDEPTSSVDSENELAIYQNIFSKFNNHTIIAAIHRLHLLSNFDYIYYFSQGKIVTEGSFSALLKDERFKKLWEKYTQQENNII